MKFFQQDIRLLLGTEWKAEIEKCKRNLNFTFYSLINSLCHTKLYIFNQ